MNGASTEPTEGGTSTEDGTSTEPGRGNPASGGEEQIKEESKAMKEYRVIITETFQKSVVVTADSKEQARRRVRDAWQNNECGLEPECFTGAEFFVTDEAHDSKQLPRIEGKDETGSPQESEVNRPQEGEDHRPQEGEDHCPQDGEDHRTKGDEDHLTQDGDCE